MDFTYNILELKFSDALEPLATYYDLTTKDIIERLMAMCAKNNIHKGCYVDIFETICKVQSLHDYTLIEERVKLRYDFLMAEAIKHRPYGLEEDQVIAAVQCYYPWTKKDQKRALVEAYCGMVPDDDEIASCVTAVECLKLAHAKLVAA